MLTELGLYNLDAVLEMYKHNFRCQIMSAARMLLWIILYVSFIVM